MEFSKYIACICEGTAEQVIMNRNIEEIEDIVAGLPAENARDWDKLNEVFLSLLSSISG